MRPAPRFFKQSDIDIIRQAKANLVRDPDDHHFTRADLVTEVNRLMLFDPTRERQAKAERMVRDQERPHKTPASGQLILPGFGAVPYEPEQLITDESGKTVERDLASPHFIGASLERSAKDLDEKVKAHRRKQAEADAFSQWHSDETLAGRSIQENTFGNCMRTLGFWQPDPPPEDDQNKGDNSND
jgi:hypothetical protein